ncbi:hypothetical protein C8R46DRAFT_1214612 [Mycena filopes]|nr:hypothetical protein C8R46DRAFT_1214612 [Mycena filopes]
MQQWCVKTSSQSLLSTTSRAIWAFHEISSRVGLYELKVAGIRHSEVDAGGEDPGRPPYVYGYVLLSVHLQSDLNPDYNPFYRQGPDAMAYPPLACG